MPFWRAPKDGVATKADKISLSNKHGYRDLLRAIAEGHTPLVERLLKAGAAADAAAGACGCTPLHSAASKGHTTFVRQPLGSRAAGNVALADSSPPLHHAALHGHTGVVLLLLHHLDA
jgi:cytohesin